MPEKHINQIIAGTVLGPFDRYGTTGYEAELEEVQHPGRIGRNLFWHEFTHSNSNGRSDPIKPDLKTEGYYLSARKEKEEIQADTNYNKVGRTRYIPPPAPRRDKKNKH